MKTSKAATDGSSSHSSSGEEAASGLASGLQPAQHCPRGEAETACAPRDRAVGQPTGRGRAPRIECQLTRRLGSRGNLRSDRPGSRAARGDECAAHECGSGQAFLPPELGPAVRAARRGSEQLAGAAQRRGLIVVEHHACYTGGDTGPATDHGDDDIKEEDELRVGSGAAVHPILAAGSARYAVARLSRSGQHLRVGRHRRGKHAFVFRELACVRVRDGYRGNGTSRGRGRRGLPSRRTWRRSGRRGSVSGRCRRVFSREGEAESFQTSPLCLSTGTTRVTKSSNVPGAEGVGEVESVDAGVFYPLLELVCDGLWASDDGGTQTAEFDLVGHGGFVPLGHGGVLGGKVLDGRLDRVALGSAQLFVVAVRRKVDTRSIRQTGPGRLGLSRVRGVGRTCAGLPRRSHPRSDRAGRGL
ncbi:hypothetical protein L1887_53647 [Cichorium endivia]|nr:hypothetical protein L1887_53647 [Cichorium endivia]